MIQISTTDFVSDWSKIKPSTVDCAINEHLFKLNCIERYTNLQKQTLELGMFVSCDEKGNVLEEPINTNYSYEERNTPIKDGQSKYGVDYLAWKQAKERIMFVACSVVYKKHHGNKGYYEVYHNSNMIWVSWNDSKTIEGLIHNRLTLTQSAQKQIGI